MKYEPDPNLALFDKNGEIVPLRKSILVGNNRFIFNDEEHRFHAVNFGAITRGASLLRKANIHIFIDNHYYCTVYSETEAKCIFKAFSTNFLTPPNNKSREWLQNIIANRVIQLTRIQDREINRQIMMDSDADWGSL